jgi:hypothetical protein
LHAEVEFQYARQAAGLYPDGIAMNANTVAVSAQGDDGQQGAIYLFNKPAPATKNACR